MRFFLLGYLPLLFQFGALTDCYTEDADRDRINKLPGTELLSANFNQFSGYLSVTGYMAQGEKTKNLHYWFVESMGNPSKDPIAFWTNGGPGCSGLIAFFSEQGPYRPNKDGSLSLNPSAWNRHCNMVFIESPTGVGFSYSNNEVELKSNDMSTATDNYNLLQAFFVRFPEYLSHSLYLTSESYGGHYIPTLTRLVIDENRYPTPTKPFLNIKGIAIGNPYTDLYSGTPAMIDTLWGHQLLSWPFYNYYKNTCTKSPQSLECANLEDQAMEAIGNLNIYALDFSICSSKKKSRQRNSLVARSLITGEAEIDEKENYMEISEPQRSKNRGEQILWLRSHQYKHLSAEERKTLSVPSTQKYEPCEEDWTVKYLNNVDVKRAINVKQDITWSACSDTVEYDYGDLSNSTAPIYKYLIDGGSNIDILIFSGDDDAVCSTLGTQNWIFNLGYSAVDTFKTYKFKEQTAGFLTRFRDTRLSFLTIHGAGHEVPAYQPEIAFDMWTKFLAGNFTRD